MTVNDTSRAQMNRMKNDSSRYNENEYTNSQDTSQIFAKQDEQMAGLFKKKLYIYIIYIYIYQPVLTVLCFKLSRVSSYDPTPLLLMFSF